MSTSPAYHPELLTELRAEHLAILRQFHRARAALADGAPIVAAEHLQRLYVLLRDHSIKENVRVVAYVERMFTDDADVIAELAQLRQELRDLTLALSSVVGDLCSGGWNVAKVTRIAHTLWRLDGAFAWRFEREEDAVFRRYMPAAAYDFSPAIEAFRAA